MSKFYHISCMLMLFTIFMNRVSATHEQDLHYLVCVLIKVQIIVFKKSCLVETCMCQFTDEFLPFFVQIFDKQFSQNIVMLWTFDYSCTYTCM